MMERYKVVFEKSMYYDIEVDANNENEAKDKALDIYLNGDKDFYLDDVQFKIYDTQIMEYAK